MNKDKTFKSTDKIPGIITLGSLIAHGNPGIQALIEWAEKKEKTCYDSLHSLITNPDIPERIINYNFGEARSVRKDLLEFLKNCERAYKLDKKKE